MGYIPPSLSPSTHPLSFSVFLPLFFSHFLSFSPNSISFSHLASEAGQSGERPVHLWLRIRKVSRLLTKPILKSPSPSPSPSVSISKNHIFLSSLSSLLFFTLLDRFVKVFDGQIIATLFNSRPFLLRLAIVVKHLQKMKNRKERGREGERERGRRENKER